MIKMKRTVAFLAAVVGMTLAGGAAQAISSINLVWQSTGTDTLLSPLASSTFLVDIVLTGTPDDGGVSAVQLTVLFDATELQAISLVEESGPRATVGKGNKFAPLNSVNTFIDNTLGIITGFDSATLGAGCLSCTITLGSITFHIIAPNGSVPQIDAVLAKNQPFEGVFNTFNVEISPTYGAAEVQVLPEPTTALLVVGGLLGLGYAGRRSVR